MATSIDYIEYVCEQIRGVGEIRYKKMFGEYMVYVNDKPVIIVCDNNTFVKKIRLYRRNDERCRNRLPI